MEFVTRFRLLSMLMAVAVACSLGSWAEAQIEWFDNFDDGDAEDGMPVTWTYNEIGFTPGIYDASSGDYSLSNPGGGDDDNLVASVDVSFTDTYVRTQAVIVPGPGPEEIGGNVGVMARWDPDTFSGYAFILDDGEQFALVRIDGGGIVELDGFDDTGIDAATDVIVELEFAGDQINGYFYRPGDPRPDTPITSVTDSTYASGRAGIVYNEDDDNTAGLFRWAQAQDFPLPPPPTTSFEADFDRDDDVDGNDFLLWQTGFGTASGAEKMDGDYDNDGDVDGNDFLGWQAEFGSQSGAGSAAVPEPAACVLGALLAIGAAGLRQRHG